MITVSNVSSVEALFRGVAEAASKGPSPAKLPMENKAAEAAPVVVPSEGDHPWSFLIGVRWLIPLGSGWLIQLKRRVQ